MQTTKVAAIGVASVFALVALLLAYPAMAAPDSGVLGNEPMSATALATTSGNTDIIPTPAALTVGQTITLTSTAGQFRVVGHPGETGTASGSMVLTVTGAFKGGYALSITSGTVTINGTSTAIASGSAEMGPHQAHMVGQGTFAASTSTATPGSFLFAAGAHANFEGNTYNTLRLDVEVNGVEYGVVLLVTAQVA